MKRILCLLLAAAALAGCLPPDTRPEVLRDPGYTEAERLFLMGDYRAARTRLDDYIARSRPRGAPAYLLRGYCNLYLNRFHEARDDFDEGVDRAAVLDEFVRGRLGLADTAFAAHEYPRSAALFADLIEDFPDRIPRDEVTARYAVALDRSGRGEQARRVRAPAAGPAVRPATPAAAGAGDFYIQAGKFASRLNARNLGDRLVSAGFDPVELETPGGFTVIVGYFKRHDDARAALARLRAAGFAGAFIKP
ncbi:MAG: SPOR domain-containing protein [Planctomycetota bacterium]